MIPKPRRQSLKKPLYWLSVSTLSLAVLAVAPLGPFTRPAIFVPLLSSISNLCFLAVVAAFLWFGPIWGLGTVSWFCLLVALGGLAARQGQVLFLALELAAMGWVAHAGLLGWKGGVQGAKLRNDRIREEGNTLSDELRRLETLEKATEGRFQRYQQLRRLANAFNLTLTPEAVLEAVVEATAGLVSGVDRVLLYLVDPEALTIQLRKVWRQAGSAPVKRKHGDIFDQWVLRQGQPLLVEDVPHDFRFDHAAAERPDRPLGSLLAVPLMSKHRCLGILRLETARVEGLGADDLRLVGIVADLASLGIENSRLYSRTAELAMTDDLTGLGIRRFFLQELEKSMAGRRSDVRGAVLLIDIDRFKDYNDQFGHSSGDKLLKQIGAILMSTRRPGETVARLGGEEFACLLQGVGKAEALRRAEEIRLRVETCPVELRRTATRITVSIGLALFPDEAQAPEQLLQAADRRLYLAKAQGRNRVCAEG